MIEKHTLSNNSLSQLSNSQLQAAEIYVPISNRQSGGGRTLEGTKVRAGFPMQRHRREKKV